ncbi:aspartic peptidase domain-containing protein [Abortiporus biennis]|nr:aspartic peptidase domain-containing protein [Abortiporus biennis]
MNILQVLFCAVAFKASKATRMNFFPQGRSVHSQVDLTYTMGLGYTGSVDVSNQSFSLLLDTTSSELWINMRIRKSVSSIDTGDTSSIHYLDGTSVSGRIYTDSITFGNYSVEGQTFLVSSGSSNTNGPEGVVGLGRPSFLNTTHPHRNSSLINNIFRLYSDVPSYITLLVNRGGQDSSLEGSLAIGEYLPEYSSITDTKKLTVQDETRWVTTVSGLTVGCKRFIRYSRRAILHSRSPYSFAPAAYVDAIYKHLPGSMFNGVDRYIIPYDTKVNISITIENQDYPIHPLDAITPSRLTNGTIQCFGSFLYTSKSSEYDFVLGIPFLTNVYTLLNYGYGKTQQEPYIQLLSITNPSKAWLEFDSVNPQRLINSNQPFAPVVAGAAATSSQDQPYNNDLKKVWIVLGCILGIFIIGGVLALIAFVMSKMRRDKTAYRNLSAPLPPQHDGVGFSSEFTAPR